MRPAGFSPGVDPPAPESGGDRLFVFRERKILTRRTASGDLIPRRLELVLPAKYITAYYYIGTMGDDQCFTCSIGNAPLPDIYAFRDLRSVYIECPADWKPAISTAVLVADWDADHQYCGRCGTPTEVTKGERCRTCASCGRAVYPRISPAVIVAIMREGAILLARNKRFTAPVYSLIAGFVEAGEYLEDTVRREVMEETGITVDTIRYFASQSWPFPDSLMIGFTANYVSGEITINEELMDAGWFTPQTMPDIPSPGTISRRIIDWYLEKEGDGDPLRETEPPGE